MSRIVAADFRARFGSSGPSPRKTDAPTPTAQHLLDVARSEQRVQSQPRIEAEGGRSEVIGRKQELALLHALIAATSASGHAVVIAGEAGIGKTMLADAVSTAARDAGFRELRCSGHQQGVALGYEGLHELLHPIIDRATALPERQRAALLTAFGIEEAVAPDRMLTSLATLSLLEDEAGHQPLLLVVEDLQWLDASSVAVVHFLARRLSNGPILLVVTVRTDSPDTDITWLPERSVLVLGPLNDDESALLLDASGAPRSGPVRDRLLKEAAGNPLALRELPAAWKVQNLNPGSTHTQPMPESLPSRLPLTRRLEAAFVSEVATLPERAQHLLLLAAAGADLPLDQLIAAARLSAVDSPIAADSPTARLTPTGIDSLATGTCPDLGTPLEQQWSATAAEAMDWVSDDLARLERSGLVTLQGGVCRFRHPLVPSAIYSAASWTQRAAAHRLLAMVAQDPARSAWHSAAAIHGHDATIAHALDDAGRDALRRGARTEAAAAFYRAAQLSPHVEPRIERLVRAAETARQAGLHVFAAQTVREAMPSATTAFAVSELASTEIGIDIQSGVPGRSVSDLLTLERWLAGPDGNAATRERAHLLWALAMRCAVRPHPPHEVQAVIAHLLALDESPSAAGAEDEPCQHIGLALLAPITHAPRLLPRLPALLAAVHTDLRVLLTLGTAAEALQDLPTAMAAWAAAREELHRIGSTADEAQTLASLARLQLVVGDLKAGADTADLALQLATEHALEPVTAAAHAAAALAHAWRGQKDAALAAVHASRELAAAARLPEKAVAAWAAGLVALTHRDYRKAWEELRETVAHPTTASWAVADVTEAALHAGHLDQAQQAVATAHSAATALGSAHLWTLVHRSLALLADGDEEQAGQHYEESIRYGRVSAARLELARSQLAYGQWLRRRRRVRDAREPLMEALHAFQAQKAEPWLQQAHGELRAAGVFTAAVDDPAPLSTAQLMEPLTAQERQIAELAATGLTNRQIGDRLYLSHRTVGAHLYRVFPKLGITSRHQLRDVMTRLNGTTV